MLTSACPGEAPVTDLPRILLFPDRRRKIDCQGGRSFLVFRTKAADVVAALRREAEEELLECERRIEADAKLHVKLGCSHAKSAHYYRCLADRIEMEGSDGS
jgi:hypothetical protein